MENIHEYQKFYVGFVLVPKSEGTDFTTTRHPSMYWFMMIPYFHFVVNVNESGSTWDCFLIICPDKSDTVGRQEYLFVISGDFVDVVSGQ